MIIYLCMVEGDGIYGIILISSNINPETDMH